MRHQVATLSQWVSKNSKDKMVSVDQLQEIANDPNSHLQDIISRKVTNIRGTRSYWINTSHELEAMVRDLNGQTLFFTASAADMQWRDLYKHIPNAAQYATASEAKRSKLA